MADETVVDAEVKDAAAPDAEGDGEAEAAAHKGKSLVQKLLSTPVLIAIAALVGGGAGVGAMMMMGGGNTPPPAAPAESAAPAEGATDKAEHTGKEEPKRSEAEIAEAKASAEAADPTDKAEEGHAAEGAPAGGGHGEGAAAAELLHKFDPFIVNVFEGNTIHYLKLEIVASTSNTPVIEEIKTKAFQMRDRFLFLVNDMSLRELVTSGGKEIFKEDLLNEFNKMLTEGRIAKLYFTDFTIQ